MRRIDLVASTLALAFASVATAAPPAAAPVVSQATVSDLKPDPAIRFGVLPSGMRYQIVHNATPPNNASLRLRIGAGSMYETEDQRGLAHFVEHMAFNGSRNVPEGEFVKRLERHGLKFGPDTNAFTSYDQTVYMLELPQTDPETVDTALFLLRETAGELTFAPEAVERERGVVLAEERGRASPNLRSYEDETRFLLGNDILAERFPIGLPDILRNAPRARLLAFYEAYYRPERATLVAVGDFDVDEMEAKIRSRFGDWSGRAGAGADLPPPAIAGRSAEAHVYAEPGLPERVSLLFVGPPDLRPDSKAVRADREQDYFGLRVLTHRLERLAAEPDAPFAFGGAQREQRSDRAEIVRIDALAKPGKARETLAVLEQERRRLIESGISQSEFDREIASSRSWLTAQASGAATRPSPDLAMWLVNAVNEKDVPQSPVQNLADFEAMVPALTTAQITETAKRLLGRPPLVYMTGPAAFEGGETALLAAYQDAARRPLPGAAVRAAAKWPYATFGTPRGIAERQTLAALGATAIRFSNGVRLTVKPTDFRKDEVLINVRFGNGRLDVPPAHPLPAFMLQFGSYSLGGLGKISTEDMQEALAGKVYQDQFWIGDDAFMLNGRTRPADLPTQLQVLAAYVTDPALRSSAWDRLRSMSGTIHDQLASTPAGVFQREADYRLHGADPRWSFPTREEIAGADLGEAKALVASTLQRGPIEIVVVGDVTVEEALKQVGATFGALPQRQASAVSNAALRVTFPGTGLVRATHKGRADQGFAFVAWPTTDLYSDRKTSRTLNLLSQVLQLRLIDEVREKQGQTYSPAGFHQASETFPGYGFMAALVEAPPEKLQRFRDDVARIATSLRDTRIGDDELLRARKPLIENLTRGRAQNAFWLKALAGVQTRSEVREAIEHELADYQEISPLDLQRAAQRYLVDTAAWKMEIVPEAAK